MSSSVWLDVWYDGLEEASRKYFAEHDIPGMFAVLNALHETVDQVRRRRQQRDLITRGTGDAQ